MSQGRKVAVVVVTYNRKALLLECLNAIIAQSVPLSKIIIVDNASTDGTEEMLLEHGIIENDIVLYHKMPTNTGGSGGFYAGLEIAREMDIDWVWIMDDDTIPYENSLEKLLEHLDDCGKVSFLASCVHGEFDEPMNVPVLDRKKTSNGYPYWYKQLDKGFVKISTATFVSILINMEALRKCGLPCRDYFIWGDDTEYTRRLTTHYGDAYLVGGSWVCHKRKNVKSVHIKNETDKNRIKNYYYHYRNRLINYRLYDGIIMYLFYFIRFEGIAIATLFSGKYGIKKFGVMQKAIFGSIKDYRKFRKFIEGELQ